jgi:hypothetical protein
MKITNQVNDPNRGAAYLVGTEFHHGGCVDFHLAGDRDGKIVRLYVSPADRVRLAADLLGACGLGHLIKAAKDDPHNTAKLAVIASWLNAEREPGEGDLDVAELLKQMGGDK